MSTTQFNKYEFLPSSILGSLGFIVLLDLVCLPLELPEDAMIARGPFPPAIGPQYAEQSQCSVECQSDTM